MILKNKPTAHNLICGITIGFSGLAIPAANLVGNQPALQPFYNTHIIDAESEPSQFAVSKASFRSESFPSPAGTPFRNTLEIQIVNSDLKTSLRIEKYLKAKFVQIKLSGGSELFIGRNDYFQNAPMEISAVSNGNLTEITFRQDTIIPIGQTGYSADHLLPEPIPLNFFNL